MKYTRYDIKSKKKKNDDWKTTLLMILAVLILAVLIGSFIFFKMFPKSMKSQDEKPKQTQEGNNGDGNDDKVVPPVEKTEEDVKEKEEVAKEKEEIKEELNTDAPEEYTMVQCGYFSTKESADSVKNIIGTNAMVLTEDSKFRVVSYLGTEEDASKLSQELTTKEIENTKVRFKLQSESVTDKAIKETIKGALDICSKFASGEIASINTEEFKKWVNNIKVAETDEKFNNFKVLKDGISSLPAEVKNTDAEKIYQIIYDVLRNYK